MSDARVATHEHIRLVQHWLSLLQVQLLDRGLTHDRSKLLPPEVEAYDALTERLAGLDYGSPEYRAVLREYKPAIAHHYAHNRHHPEHFENGVLGMTLIDLAEMVCDWMAAAMRSQNDLLESMERNQQRFGFSDELKQILINTIIDLQQ